MPPPPVIWICETCGAHYERDGDPPAECPICQDERQYVPATGQRWIQYAQLVATHSLVLQRCEDQVLRLRADPTFAIGQQAHLIGTPEGNVLWDCLPLLDDATYQLVAGMGGLEAIAISHPHFYTGMVEWSRAFDDAPIYLHAADREWVTRRSDRIVFWDEPRVELLPGATLIHCGGHFPGSATLHVESAAAGDGALFTGDTVQVGPSRDRVGFMYSYPNHIPLGPGAVRGIRDALAGVGFARLYGSFGDVLHTDGEIIARSARRYLEALETMD